MSLNFVDHDAPRTQDVLLYGPPKVGKTIGALSAPGPILYLNAEGPDAAVKARQIHAETEIREVSFEDRSTLNEVYLYLRDGNGVRTLVVDSIGEIYRKLIHQIGGDNPKIQHWGDVNKIIERFVRSVRDLPINVVLVCHEQIDDAEGDRIVRPATGGQQLPQILMAMVSTIGYCGVIPATDDTPRRYVAQLVEAKGRRAGSRWQEELGEHRELDLTDWLTVIAGSAATAKLDAEREQDGAKPKRARRRAAKPKADANGSKDAAEQAELEGAAA